MHIYIYIYIFISYIYTYIYIYIYIQKNTVPLEHPSSWYVVARFFMFLLTVNIRISTLLTICLSLLDSE